MTGKEIRKLNEAEIAAGLSRHIAVTVFDSIDSTNTEARRRLMSGLRTPAVFLAEEQTAGRGRLGHSFYSPKYSGLYLTLVWPAGELRDQMFRVTAKTAVAAVRGIQSVMNLALQIKWVNDIYIGDKKAAGILTECVSVPEPGTGGIGSASREAMEQMKKWLVIGIGINVTTSLFPEDLIGKAKALNPFGDGEEDQDNRALPDRNALAAAVINELLYELCHPGDTEYLSYYRAWSNVIGQRIVYGAIDDGTAKQRFGTALMIEDDGALLVEREDGTRERLDSGEIRVRSLKGEF